MICEPFSELYLLIAPANKHYGVHWLKYMQVFVEVLLTAISHIPCVGRIQLPHGERLLYILALTGRLIGPPI